LVGRREGDERERTTTTGSERGGETDEDEASRQEARGLP